MNSVTKRPSARRSGPSGPLSDVRVLDLSAYIAGPFGCTILADQGADVIKIEPPAGDNLRNYPSTLKAESRAFIGLNRSKRGLVLDLKTAEGLSILMRLVRSADVFVHNFRPEVPKRLGIDFEQLQLINSRLIYCSVTGFGESGPMKNKAGYDQVLQSMSGICAMQGDRNGQPQIVYGSVVDYYAAALLASGVSSALYERERSGLGQKVGVSLLRSALTMQSARLVWAEGEPREICRDFRSGGISGLHPTSDGYIYISANTSHFWEALCKKVELLEFLDNDRYDSVRKRAERAPEILPKLREALRTHTALEWEAIFGDEVPNSAVRPIEDVFSNEQVMAEDMVTDFEHAVIGCYRGQAQSVKFSRTPGPKSFAAPAIGQHSDDVLVEADYTPEEREELRTKGVIK